MGDVIHLWRECVVCKLWFMPTGRQDTMHPDCAAHLDDAQAAAAEPRRARRDAKASSWMTRRLAPLPSGSFTPRSGGEADTPDEETPESDDIFDTPEDEAS